MAPKSNLLALTLLSLLAVLWLAGCGAAAPFEKTHFSTTAVSHAGTAVFKAEVPKGYQTFLEARNGSTTVRWDFLYSDSSRFYVAVIPERIIQKAIASSETPSGPSKALPLADSLPISGQDAVGLYWMERQVAGVRVGYRNVPHEKLYLFNYAIESFQRK